MADISILTRLAAGQERNVDISANTLVTLSIKVGGGVSNTELTKAILDRLVNLQNGSDVDATYHTHDGRYFTETELSQATGVTGSDRIGDDNSYSNFTPAAATVKGALSGIDAALATAGGTTFSDADFEVYNDADPTKIVKVDAAGLTTGTTRTIEMPDADVDLGEVNSSIQQDGSRAFTANQSMGTNKLTNLANGTAPADAVNYAQLQAAMAGLDFQPDVDAYVADGATEYPGTGLPAAATGQRYIIADTSALDAAWGTITGVGDNDIVQYDGSDWVVAYDVSVQGEGAIAWNRDADYFMRWDGTSWDEFGGLSGVVAGAGLIKTGNILAIELDTNPGLEFDTPGDAGKLRAKVDNSTIERVAGGLRVKAAGITGNELASASVDENKIVSTALDSAGALSGGSGTKLKANVDNSSIEINTNALRVKTTAYDQDTIVGGSGSVASVDHAPLVKRTLVAGESFAANTSFAVRWALTGETAGRVYKADKDASSVNKYAAIGIALSTSAVSAGQNIAVVLMGEYTQGSSDTPFSSGDVGKELFVGTTGALILGSALANTANEAQYCIGVIQTTTKIWVDYKQLRGIA